LKSDWRFTEATAVVISSSHSRSFTTKANFSQSEKENPMSYYFAKTLDMPFEAAVEHVTKALAEKGFGVLTTIDVKETMKKKIGVDMKPYRILGACNPHFAFRAIQSEDKIGTMLPCNVLVIEHAPGQVEVAAVDPVASMSAVRNAELGDVAQVVQTALKEMVEGL
jgi:uncharacterized protein (DUF302 family)